MARLTITPSNLTSGSTTTNATSYTPSSVAPAASALLLLCVLTSRAGASPPTPSTVLIDFGGVAQAGASWSIDQFVDVNTGGADGADAVIQSSTVDSAGVGVTALATALSSSLEHSSNLDYVAVGLGGVTATVTQDARFGELADVSFASPAATMSTAYAIGEDAASPSWTSARAVAISVEVKSGGTTDLPDPGADPPRDRLYVFFGQSNAVGGGPTDELSASNLHWIDAVPGVQILHRTGCDTYGSACAVELGFESLQPHPSSSNPGGPRVHIGAEITAGHKLMSQWGPGHVYIVHHATNGTNLYDDWNPDATTGLRLFQRMVDTVNAAVASTGAEVCGAYWCQANGDASTVANAEGYGDRLIHLIERTREELGADVVFAFDQLSPYSTNRYLPEIRDQQQRVVDLPQYQGNVRMVRTEGYVLRDLDQHYASDSFITLGFEVARTLIEMETRMGTTTPALIRDRLSTIIQALTPGTLAGTKFLESRDEYGGDFKAWASGHADAALRRFPVRWTGRDEAAAISGIDVEQRRVEFELRVAYPQSHRYGQSGGRSRDDVMAEDFNQIDF